MVLMLPTPTDYGARLAEVFPTALASVVAGHRADGDDAPISALGASVKSFVVIVVDGLGWDNLEAMRGHARVTARLDRIRLETVRPSTTGAALTTLATGTLPGVHGLVGYRIRHPQLGLVNTLKEWDGISEPRTWQRSATVFERAAGQGVRAVAIGRPAHARGGLTEAVLRGAEYLPGQRIEDRFARALEVLRSGEPAFVYLYVDELDRAGHAAGWRSSDWTDRLEQFDAALDGFLREMPATTGVCLTADHGMVDIGRDHHVELAAADPVLEGVREIGGEPRLRYLYLDDPADADRSARRLRDREGERAWVLTRADAIDRGLFGPDVSPVVRARIGDVLLAAKDDIAYYTPTDSPESRGMIGQHGSFTPAEVGVPLCIAGAADPRAFEAALTGARRG